VSHAASSLYWDKVDDLAAVVTGSLVAVTPRNFLMPWLAYVMTFREKAMFNDISNPELGGMVSMLGQGNDFSTFSGGVVTSSGTTTADTFDNIAISRFNQVLIKEDTGNVARLSRLWLYDLTTDSMLEIGIPDANRFIVGGSDFLTQNEETSGIVDAWDIIGPGWWMLDMQAHYGISGELVEGGQMMAVFIPQTVPTPGAAALLGLGGLLAGRRRRTR